MNVFCVLDVRFVALGTLLQYAAVAETFFVKYYLSNVVVKL